MAPTSSPTSTSSSPPTPPSDIFTKRNGAGAILGGAIGFLFAGPPGAAVGALVGGGVAHASGNSSGKGVMTAKRRVIYLRSMESIKDPSELDKLAAAFAQEGLAAEAAMLRKRAALRRLPEATKEQRRAAFRKAMAADNVDIILKIADAFEAEGALDAGKSLREHAEAVKAAHLAGKSAKPLTGGSQAAFAEKLAKAIIHFGPGSSQAMTAAKNLIQARGKAPTDALAGEVIRVAADALKVDAPQVKAANGGGKAPKKPITIDATPAAAAGVSEGPMEPLATGQPPGEVEPPVIRSGETPDVAAVMADGTSDGTQAPVVLGNVMTTPALMPTPAADDRSPTSDGGDGIDAVPSEEQVDAQADEAEARRDEQAPEPQGI